MTSGSRRLNEFSSLPPVHSEEHPFRVLQADEKDLLKCNPRIPKRTGEISIMKNTFKDLAQEEATQSVIDGSSLLVLGIAGTGKTHFCQGIVEQLRSLGKRVDVISKTHTASRRAGNGVTADHWVRKHVLHGCCSADYVWIDEISQLDIGLWSQINKLTYTNTKFLLSGDFNQFAPLFNTWKGATIPEDALEKSALLYRLADGNRVTLTECRRSDTRLFDFYSSLIPGGSRADLPLCECIKQAKEQFNFEGDARWNLVISHYKRVKINRELNAKFKPVSGAVWLEVKGCRATANSAQSMWIWPGLLLFGCAAGEKRGIRNQCLYEIEKIKDEEVKVKDNDRWFTFDDVKQLFRLSFAQTFASCQGTEFDGKLRLWDTSNPHFSKTHLFVALSRAKQAAFVDLQP